MYMNVIRSLCSLPATDLNFTSELNRATAYQIKQAIETMKQNGGKNKGRIKACERELENRRLTKKDKHGKYVSKEHLSILCNTFSSEHRLKAIMNKLGEYEDAERQDKWIPVTERLPEDGIVGKWCPKINDSPHLDIERDCEHYKAMTNADRIRSMTDEELASFLKEVKEDYQLANPDYPDCEDCGEWLNWLQSEAEMEKNDGR